jgi:hypothetical protein
MSGEGMKNSTLRAPALRAMAADRPQYAMPESCCVKVYCREFHVSI